MSARMDLNLLGVTFTDYHLTDVGSSAFGLEHDWFTRQDLVIRTAAAGGGTLLVEGTDYTLDTESTDLSERVTDAVGSGRNVFREVAIINAAYQSGDLYFSGKYIADSVEAEDQNDIRPMLTNIIGLTLSNNSGDANNDIDIAAGRCLASGGDEVMVLSAALTKRSDAAWAVGDDAGGMDTGTKPAAGWLYVWLIKKPDTGIVDALFSISATSPTMPTGYTLKRRLGVVRTSSSNILGFIQNGDRFLYKAPQAEGGVTSTTSRAEITVKIPPSMMGILGIGIAHASARAAVYVSNPDLTDVAPSAGGTVTLISQVNSVGIALQIQIPVDSSSQISHRSDQTSTTFIPQALGWIDRRGQDEVL